ncbi:MAG TPA: hypothetical protein VFQ61_17235 [Polyangiaceae bacterium]|nr:hypothetical protein [Polyangiaceae bacterium]
MHRGVQIWAVLGALTWAGLARAQGADARAELASEMLAANRSEETPPVAASSREAKHWYGWQTLLVDGAALGIVAGGFAVRPAHSDWSVVSVVGVGAWVLGAPAVHLAHGRVGVSFASLGLRLALPALGGYLASRPCSSGECSAQTLGVLVGAALIPAPMLIDAVWLAREPREGSRSARRTVNLFPFATSSERRRFLGVAGTF